MTIKNGRNVLLSSLPMREQAAIEASLEPFALRQGTILHAPDSTVSHVYFPLSGLVSLLAVTRNADAIESGVVGNEGVVGAGVATGVLRSVHQSVVQIPGEALRIEAHAFAKVYQAHPVFRSFCNSYQNYVLLQAQQNVACHALHDIESRLCRWLLRAQDAIGADTLPLTQEFLSHMLGVRRSSVSITAHKIQKAGLVRYARGNITILDREGLEDCACECYATLRNELEAALPVASKAMG